MRILISVAFLFLMTLPAQGQGADKETFECSCTGTVQVGEPQRRGKIRWRQRQFMFNVWQNTFVSRNNLVNETHNFNRSGYLSKGGRLRLVGLTADMEYVLYENDLFFLKIPRKQGGNIYFKQKMNVPIGSQDVLAGWQILCTSSTVSGS